MASMPSKSTKKGLEQEMVALLSMDDETIYNNTRRILNNYQRPERAPFHPLLEEAEIMEVYEQLALYRIRAYEVSLSLKIT
jgi:hypothetical protein